VGWFWMAKKATRTDRLANAPLIEVVFELRWKLQGGEQLPAALRADPGTIPLPRATSLNASLRHGSHTTGGFFWARFFWARIYGPPWKAA
jgi:hypothetical protein